MSIVDHLADIGQAISRPKLKKLSLPQNGIEPEYCLYFTQIIPFETLEELNLMSNWFGLQGINRFGAHFKKFKRLRLLNFGNLKLGEETDQDRSAIRDILLAVKDTM